MLFLFYFILLASPITETVNQKCLMRQGCHNSGEQITVVSERKRYARNIKATYETDTLRETLHGGQMVFQDRGYSLGPRRDPRSTYT